MMKITRLALLSTVLALILSIAPSPTNALSGSEFQAGKIIDDSKFFSGPTMSVPEIQAFLNAKVPVCDTWGNQPYGGSNRAAYAASRGVSTPFTCVKDYRENSVNKPSEAALCNGYVGKNESSAEILHNVSASCGISVQVLIVLLQKEQALITDDWPWPVQYRTATGYGCPDTAACDTQYYGFFNQVYNAARQFKRYAAYSTEYGYQSGRNNFIKWHPDYWNSSTGAWEDRCGGSAVYIQNKATAGLYNYTPYQPNAVALSDLYGSQDDGCSSYGNRNFWRQFNDWFGTTHGASRDAYLLSATNTNNWLEYGKTQTVTVTVRNTGNDGWCADGYCPAGQAPTRLVAQNYAPYGAYDSQDPAWVNSAQVKMQTPSVRPGESGSFVFKVKAPFVSGFAASSRFYVNIGGVGVTSFAENANLWIGTHAYAPPAPTLLSQTQQSSTSLLPDQEAAATITLRNNSQTIWYADSNLAAGRKPTRLHVPGYVASPFYNKKDTRWLTSSQIAMTTPVVNPGETAVFEFTLLGPLRGVSGPLKLVPVIDGATALQDIGINMNVSTPEPSLSYQFVSASFPPAQTTVGATSTQKASISIKNTSNTIWRNDQSGAANPTRIVTIFPIYRSSAFTVTSGTSGWLAPSQIAMKTPLVNPGEIAVFEFDWKAPSQPGSYLEYFSLVTDGYKFFPMYGSAWRTTVTN